jgi:hypothetical protein
MAEDEPLEGTPYFFAERLPYKEAELVAYIRREHRRGRHLSEILNDPEIERFGSRTFLWQTLRDTPLLELLDEDDREAIQRGSADVPNQE